MLSFALMNCIGFALVKAFCLERNLLVEMLLTLDEDMADGRAACFVLLHWFRLFSFGFWSDSLMFAKNMESVELCLDL